MQTIIHYFLHIGFPLIVAIVFYKKEWKKIYVILLATMLVDLDHLLAMPIFQVDRCSIGFHLLHSYPAIILYLALLFFKKPFRIIGIGLLLHMITDFIDCVFMYERCSDCFINSPLQPYLKITSNLIN